MSDDSADLEELIRLVVKRAGFLERLGREPTSKRDLRDEVGVSRSTVYKAVRELEDAGLVEQRRDGCRLTLLGRLLVEQYRDFVTVAADVQRAAPVLSGLPPDCPLSMAGLVDAELALPERHAPKRPIKYVEEAVRTADRIAVLTPVVLPPYVSVLHEELVAGRVTAELVIERPVLEHVTAEYSAQVAETLETGRVSGWTTDETLPFGLLVAERDDRGSDGERTEVVVVFYDENGDLRGLLRNDTAAAVEWGRETFRTYRATAEELDR